jgi:hypothetical protein
MKKIFVLVIALAVIGMTVAPQAQAQEQKKIEQLMKEAEAIGKRVEAERRQPTAQEIQRLQQIQQEMAAAAGYGGAIPQQPQSLSPQQQQQLEQMQRQPQPQWAQEQPRRQDQMQQGAKAGWPPASAFQGRFKIAPFTQPNGTTARYDGFEGGGGTIYLTGGNAAAVTQNLKQQIERAAKKQMQNTDGVYTVHIQDPNYKDVQNSIQFMLETIGDIVELTIRPVAN